MGSRFVISRQSFECSTLGGWIATRSGGHFATRYTHIDDLVESLRVITPKGVIETRRLPGWGRAKPDRLLMSFGRHSQHHPRTWMRLQDRARFRADGAVQFTDFSTAARRCSNLRRGLCPANAASSKRKRRANTGAADGNVAIMVLAFHSGDHPVEPWMKRAHECSSITARDQKSRLHLTLTAKARPAPGAMPLFACPLRASAPFNGARQRYVRNCDRLGAVEVIPRQGQGRDRARHRRGDGRPAR